MQLAADKQATEDWWSFHRQHYKCYISAAVFEEVQCGDPAFAAARVEKLRGLPLLPETDAVRELSERLLHE